MSPAAKTARLLPSTRYAGVIVLKDGKRARVELPAELQELRRRIREYKAVIREFLGTGEKSGAEGEHDGDRRVSPAPASLATGQDAAPPAAPSRESPGHYGGYLHPTTAEELSEYGKFLEELVEDRTLEIMMTNERLQNEIAERMQVEEELRARNAELEAFAHTVSHDLRSSLAVIEGYAQVALEGREDILQECLEKIVHLTQRMESFIESLLAYSEAGRPEGEPEDVNASELLREMLEEREVEITALGAEVIVEEDLPTVRVDPMRLQQVFINLLDNALKYTGGSLNPTVRCGAVEKEGAAVFYVSDNGIGIPREDQLRIFEPFERLSGGNHRGLGIGLSTVKLAVEGWGGGVWVESEPGKGSTFFFSIPTGGADAARK